MMPKIKTARQINKTDWSHKYKICVSGSASMRVCGIDAKNKAILLGEEIARHGAVITSGATTGFPYWSSFGAKRVGGVSIGISPAVTEVEHVKKYHLPTDTFDLIIYTGSGYSGRNLLLTRSSDAVILGCGRIGTINEFTTAFEDKKPIGVLEGEWTLDETLKKILEDAKRGTSAGIVFDSDPVALVQKIIFLIDKKKKHSK